MVPKMPDTNRFSLILIHHLVQSTRFYDGQLVLSSGLKSRPSSRVFGAISCKGVISRNVMDLNFVN